MSAAWCAIVAVLAAGTCAVLAVHHPLSAIGACLVSVAIALAAFMSPTAWPIWMLPLVPVAGLATWTGWLTVEELDLLVLAAGAGLFSRWAIVLLFEDSLVSYPSAMGFMAAAVWASLGVSLLAAAWRGVVDAGGLEWGWWQGYHESMNSIRLLKSWPMAMLLLPAWVLAVHRDGERVGRAWSAGMTAMLGVIGLLVLWERIAYTGLLNFSTDYRTTALFWEMHVGGAALDAFLAMAFPFAWYSLVHARTARTWVATAVCVGLGAYACVTTFSRIVFIAIPLGLAVMAGLGLLQRLRGYHAKTAAPSGWLATALLLAAFVAASILLFPRGGYRSILALWLAFVLLLPMASIARDLSPKGVAHALALGVAWVAANTAMALAFDKGAYVVTVAAALIAVGSVWGSGVATRGGNASIAILGLGSFLAVVAGVPLVAMHWGATAALRPGLGAAGALLMALLMVRLAPAQAWPTSWRWRGGLACAFGAAVIVVGAFSGGAYLSERFENSESDKSSRVEHWRKSLGLLRGNVDWWVGKGLGRYVGQHFISGLAEDQTGDYRWHHDDQGAWLVLTGGKHMLGWGELLRISQRVSPPQGPVTVTLDVRAAEATVMHVEICEQHLLYNGACVAGQIGIQGKPGAWQTVQVRPTGDMVSRGHWFAPNLIGFAMAVETPGGKVEVDNVSVRSALAGELLLNGGFEDGMSHWYFSSERHHMPWHAKNLWVHLMFEQGVSGVVLMILLLVSALWRLGLGAARHHPLAGPLAAAVVGVVAIGLVDSLLDMPRVAFMLYLLVGIGLTLPGRLTPMPTPLHRGTSDSGG